MEKEVGMSIRASFARDRIQGARKLLFDDVNGFDVLLEDFAHRNDV